MTYHIEKQIKREEFKFILFISLSSCMVLPYRRIIVNKRLNTVVLLSAYVCMFSATSTGGATAMTSESESEEADMGRLQGKLLHTEKPVLSH